MYIKTLLLNDFRNYEKEAFEFENGINLLTGANAQGKTNCAEAIFFLCTGYSPRAGRDKLVIRHGCDKASVEGKAVSSYGDVSVKIEFNKNDGKDIFVNGMPINKIGDLLGNIHSVFFNPSELKLVQESPEDRRRFLNISLCQMSKSYFYALSRYNKILAQRNNLLKDRDLYMINDTLPVWDRQLCREAAKIIRARNDFLSDIAPVVQEKHAVLSGGKEKLSMKTESGYFGEVDEIENAFYTDLQNERDRDIRLGYTSVGPHRDDIKFTVDGQDARIYASQGQQRTVALSLKLAETELFKKRFGEYPVLILDDVLSELDKTRQRKLISSVEHLQTVFTATDAYSAIFGKRKIYRTLIEGGKIKKHYEKN